MPLETRHSDGLITHSNERRQLGYTPETQEFLMENPEVASKVRAMVHELDSDFQHGASRQNEELSVQLVRPHKVRPIYRVNVKGNLLFLKRVTNPTHAIQGGFHQLESTYEAKQRLADIPWVKVVDFKLGYTTKAESFYISEWVDSAITSLESYLENKKIDIEDLKMEGKDSKKLEDEVADLERKVDQLEKRLVGYVDFEQYNIGYDPKTEKILLYDLNKHIDADRHAYTH